MRAAQTARSPAPTHLLNLFRVMSDCGLTRYRGSGDYQSGIVQGRREALLGAFRRLGGLTSFGRKGDGWKIVEIYCQTSSSSSSSPLPLSSYSSSTTTSLR